MSPGLTRARDDEPIRKSAALHVEVLEDVRFELNREVPVVVSYREKLLGMTDPLKP